jgi:superfamily II DNA or RNA helicase
MIIKLRPYQTAAIQRIRQEYASGTRKVLLHLSTGAGKTVCFAYMLKELKPGKKALVIVAGRTLVDQASRRLDDYDISHGVIMSNHRRKEPDQRIQVCSIDTLGSYLKRGKSLPEADLIIIDEGHNSGSETYKKIIAKYQGAYFLPVTATPHLKDGLRHIADKVIRPITFKELVAMGSLVPAKYYCPISIDRKKLKISSTGDYSQDSMEETLSQSTIFGDIVFHYKKFLDQKPAIVFAVNLKHAKIIQSKFKDLGIPCAYVDAKTPGNDRLKTIQDIESGVIKVIVNVGIFCTGLDVPCLKGVIMARPTKSYNLYIQQLGRGTRPFQDKDHFILLDHVGNVLEHGLAENELECNLDGVKRDKSPNLVTKKIHRCIQCDHVWEQGNICPQCGTAMPIVEREIAEKDGELQEFSEDKLTKRIKKKIQSLEAQRKSKDYKKAWIYHKLVQRFGIDDVRPYVPYYIIDHYRSNT